MLAIKRGRSNSSIVFICISCAENDYHRVVSEGQLSLTSARTAGAAAVCKERLNRVTTSTLEISRDS